MTDYPLKTLGQIYADNPVSPSATDLILLWKSGAMGAATVNQLLSLIVAGAPDALDDINELAAAIGDDENFAAAVTALINAKLAKDQNLADLTDKAAARNNLGIQLEPGAVMFFARTTAPNGWIKANGALLSRAAYPELFAALGTTFGAGDNSTTFGIPDLRGEFLRGFDDGRGVDGGRVFGSAQAQALQSHSHTIRTQDLAAIGTAVGVPSPGSGPTQSTETTGGTETRPRNIALLACIKY